MIFEGQFYIAYDEIGQRAVIDRFMDDESCKSLLIIDRYLRIERIKELRADHDCFVAWLLENSSPANEQRKIIYIHEAFDDRAQDFMFNEHGLLAFMS